MYNPREKAKFEGVAMILDMHDNPSRQPVGHDVQSKSGHLKEVLRDYEICCLSRAASEMCRKEVLTGKAKFGIGGSGKEVAQVALAKAFRKGDFRAGYYRDQTIMLALDLMTLEDYFAQLYADVENDPFSSGRQMVCHFSTAFCDETGSFLDLNDRYNMSSDISSTAGQVTRGIGLAFASKKYAEIEELSDHLLNCQGRAVTFLNIGDGSTSEGCFFEGVNAAAVLQIPLAISVWDDGYAISVTKKDQTVKESISKALEGFLRDSDHGGIRIYTAKGWDYPGLCEMYLSAVPKIREEHVPALFHVHEMTQPLGHSTSGSHTRYKGEERMQFEKEYDCILKMREWIIDTGIANDEELSQIEKNARQEVKRARDRAWQNYMSDVMARKESLLDALKESYYEQEDDIIKELYDRIKDEHMTNLSHMISEVKGAFYELGGTRSMDKWQIWLEENEGYLHENYHSHLYAQGDQSIEKIESIPVDYAEDVEELSGFEILNRNFEVLFERHPTLFAFGEDVGALGDVNQGMAGLQSKFGKKKIFDTGIREWTIIGQALGMAMRGLRPIAEIQYLDYLIYALAPMTDDIATLRYRSNGRQKAPCIIRTRGHRLEGIWHTGSPMSMLINTLRGFHVCVPRNMVQAAGMYNTIMKCDDPVLVVECLNAYRKKERLPINLGEFCVRLGQIEVLQSGKDISIVTYGACVAVALEAIPILEQIGISVELIDIQTLLPFDLDHDILKSVQKTNKLLIVDEDTPGGASAYIMQQVLEEQGAFDWLEIPVRTVSAREHRTPYGDNGDYVTKPNRDQVVSMCVNMMSQVSPDVFSMYKLKYTIDL